MKKLPFFLILALPLFQNCLFEDINRVNVLCSKDCVEVFGKFTSESTLVPVENVALELSWEQSCGMGGCWFGSSSRLIATTETNVNGEYRFTFSVRDHELDGGGSFIVSFVPPNTNYVSGKCSFVVDVIERNSEISHNYHLPAKGMMTLSLTNPEELLAGDIINCRIGYEYGDENELEWRNFFNQTELSATVNCEVAGNQKNIISVFKRKSGVETIWKDTVYVYKHMPYEYEITF